MTNARMIPNFRLQSMDPSVDEKSMPKNFLSMPKSVNMLMTV